MIFQLLFVYILICTFIYKLNKRLKAQYIIAVFLPLSLLMAFRSPNMHMCVDTHAYMDIFRVASYRSWSDILSFDAYQGSEFGYWILNKAFLLLSTNYLHFQIFISVLTCGFIGYFIYKHMDNPILGIALYLGMGYYFFSYNISRQMLVVSIFALCIPLFATRKNILLSIVLCFLLSSLHTSSLLYLLCPAFLIIPRKLEKIMPVLLLLFVVFFISIMQFSMAFFNKYEHYYDNTSEHEFSLGMSTIVYVILLGISVIVYYSKKIQKQQFKLYSIFSMFSMLCIFLGLRLNYMERVGLLFFPFVLLTVTKFGDCFDDRGIRSIYLTLLTFLMFVSFILRFPDYFFYV